MCVQVELYMAELYNKVGVGLMTWSPVSLGLALGSREEQLQVFTKLAVKVHTTLIVLGIYYILGWSVEFFLDRTEQGN